MGEGIAQVFVAVGAEVTVVGDTRNAEAERRGAWGRLSGRSVLGQEAILRLTTVPA